MRVSIPAISHSFIPFLCFSPKPLFPRSYDHPFTPSSKTHQFPCVVLLFPPQPHVLSSSLLLLSSFFFFGSLFHHPILSQHSAESITGGSVVCPLKRSGGITPLIPLWENKSRGRPVCEISYRQERDGRNQRGGDTEGSLCWCPVKSAM